MDQWQPGWKAMKDIRAGPKKMRCFACAGTGEKKCVDCREKVENMQQNGTKPRGGAEEVDTNWSRRSRDAPKDTTAASGKKSKTVAGGQPKKEEKGSKLDRKKFPFYDDDDWDALSRDDDVKTSRPRNSPNDKSKPMSTQSRGDRRDVQRRERGFRRGQNAMNDSKNDFFADRRGDRRDRSDTEDDFYSDHREKTISTGGRRPLSGRDDASRTRPRSIEISPNEERFSFGPTTRDTRGSAVSQNAAPNRFFEGDDDDDYFYDEDEYNSLGYDVDDDDYFEEDESNGHMYDVDDGDYSYDEDEYNSLV